ncbi:MAG: patatin-like phospholipase family protein [Hyphomicrobiales bacterium]
MHKKASEALQQRQRELTAQTDIKADDSTDVYAASGVHDTTGLALSGGGIRSAAYCMGAMQALAVGGLETNSKGPSAASPLARFDYVSSVSGGGYTGIAATLASAMNGGAFPFVDTDAYRDTPAMQTIRNNANYLLFGKFRPMLKNLAIVLKGVASNLTLTAAVLLLLAAFTLRANPTVASLDVAGFDGLRNFLPFGLEKIPFGASVVTIIIGFVISLSWAIYAGLRGGAENFKGNFLVLSSVWLALAAVSVFFELQPVLVKQMISDRDVESVKVISQCLDDKKTQGIAWDSAEEQAKCVKDRFDALQAADTKKAEDDRNLAAQLRAEGKTLPEQTSTSAVSGFKRVLQVLQALLAPALAALAFASKYLGDILKKGTEEQGYGPAFKRFMAKAAVVLAGLALPFVLWAAYLGLVYWGVVIINKGAETAIFAPGFLPGVFSRVVWNQPVYAFPLFYCVCGLALIGAWLLSSNKYPNANSLHLLYRGRLGNAFCLPWLGEGSDQISKLDTKLVPFPIINAALNVQASPRVNKRGRNADFFSFTPLYVGSAATGFARTSDYEGIEKNLGFATAMAISGAAASSNMGAQSIRPLTFTLALLNIRLGAWLENPATLSGKTWKVKWPSFFKEITGRLSEDEAMVYLTDGGHIENLGVYELLRRRCKLIVVVDAEADPEMNFTSFVNLQRYARIDLGCRIELDVKKLKASALAVQRITPATAGGSAGESQTNGPHCAIGKIVYDKGHTGYMLYVKSSLSGDENDYVMAYNKRNYDFPHETTADQFFSEEQFECYRAIGFHAVNGVLTGRDRVETSNGLENLLDGQAKGEGVAAVRNWLGLKAKTASPAYASSSQE